MFPVRCHVVRGLGMTVMPYQQQRSNAVVLMPGAGYNLQSLPGYVGNNPPMVVASAKNVFEQPQYPVQQAVQVQQAQQAQQVQQTPPPPPRNNSGMHISLPRQVVTVQPPPVQPPPVQPPPVQISPVEQGSGKSPSYYEQAQQAYAAAQQTMQQPAQTVVEAPKSTATATVVGISAAGILAALLFK